MARQSPALGTSAKQGLDTLPPSRSFVLPNPVKAFRHETRVIPRMDAIKRICRDDPAALDAIDRATKGKQGERTNLVDNVNDVKPDGNSKQSAIRRLRKDRPDLHANKRPASISESGLPWRLELLACHFDSLN